MPSSWPEPGCSEQKPDLEYNRALQFAQAQRNEVIGEMVEGEEASLMFLIVHPQHTREEL